MIQRSRAPIDEKIYPSDNVGFRAMSSLWVLWFQDVSNKISGYFDTRLEATQFKLSALNTAPASAGAAGELGEIRIDANFVYVCTATNVWVRAQLNTW